MSKDDNSEVELMDNPEGEPDSALYPLLTTEWIVRLSPTSVSNSVVQQSVDVTGTSCLTVRPNSKYFGVSTSGKLEVC